MDPSLRRHAFQDSLLGERVLQLLVRQHMALRDRLSAYRSADALCFTSSTFPAHPFPSTRIISSQTPALARAAFLRARVRRLAPFRRPRSWLDSSSSVVVPVIVPEAESSTRERRAALSGSADCERRRRAEGGRQQSGPGQHGLILLRDRLHRDRWEPLVPERRRCSYKHICVTGFRLRPRHSAGGCVRRAGCLGVRPLLHVSSSTISIGEGGKVLSSSPFS